MSNYLTLWMIDLVSIDEAKFSELLSLDFSLVPHPVNLVPRAAFQAPIKTKQDESTRNGSTDGKKEIRST